MSKNDDYKAEFEEGFFPRLYLIGWCFCVFVLAVFSPKEAKEVAKGYIIYKRNLARMEADKKRFPYKGNGNE